MAGTAARRMSAPAFPAWTSDAVDGRFVRVGGEIVAIAPERVAPALVMGNVREAL